MCENQDHLSIPRGTHRSIHFIAAKATFAALNNERTVTPEDLKKAGEHAYDAQQLSDPEMEVEFCYMLDAMIKRMPRPVAVAQ